MPIKTYLGKSVSDEEFLPATLWFFRVGEAMQRMRDLHRCAIGAAAPSASAYTTGLTAWQANGYYHSAVAAAIGQIAVTATPTRVQLLKGVVQASAAFRSVEGLESVYASLLSAAAAAGETAAFTSAWNNLQGLGIPSPLGAGAPSSPVFNAQSGSLSFLNEKEFGSLFGHSQGVASAASFNSALAELGIGGLPGSSGLHGTGGLGVVRPSGASEVSDHHFEQCVAAWGFTVSFGGAVVVGTGAAALTSETGPGALVAFGAGAEKGGTWGLALGTFFGTFACSDSDSSDKKQQQGETSGNQSSSGQQSKDQQSKGGDQSQQSKDDGQSSDSDSSSSGSDSSGSDSSDDGKDKSGDSSDSSSSSDTKSSDQSGSTDGTPRPGDAGDATGGSSDGKLNTTQFGNRGGDPTGDINYNGGSGRLDPSRVSGGDIDPVDGDDGKDRNGRVNVAYLPGSGLIDPTDDGPRGDCGPGPLHGGTPVASVMPTTALASKQIKATAHGFQMEGLPSFDAEGKLVSEGVLANKLIAAFKGNLNLAGRTVSTVKEHGSVLGTLKNTIRREPTR